MERKERDKQNHAVKLEKFKDILEKTCNKCGETKIKEEFYKNRGTLDGYLNHCKECDKKQSIDDRNNNLEKYKSREREQYQTHKESKNKWHSEHRKKNRKRYTEYCKKSIEKKKDDVIFRLKGVVRSRTGRVINKSKVGKSSLDLIGCTYEELVIHLEKQFKEGMNWENRGKYGWHIDHKIPLNSAKTEEELIKLCHYTNLQPLWAEENLRKSNTLITK